MADRAPPTPVAMIIATALLAGISGYMIGIASSLGFLPIPFAPQGFLQSIGGGDGRRRVGRTAGYDNEEESSEEEIDDDDALLAHVPNWGSAGEEKKKPEQVKAVADNGEECKLVLVVRTDLGMTKGTHVFHSLPKILSAYGSRADNGCSV